jgi:hypothetical protein
VAAVLIAGLAVWGLSALSASPTAKASLSQPGLRGPWAQFASECTSAPSSESSCECWATHLQAEAVEPDDALDALNAAELAADEVSPPTDYAVAEYVSADNALNQAAQGCGLFRGARLSPAEDWAASAWP